MEVIEMFSTSKERYFKHINRAAWQRENIRKYLLSLEDCNQHWAKVYRCLIERAKSEHSYRLQMAKLERETTHYKSL